MALERPFFSFLFPFFTKSMSVKIPLAVCFATYTKLKTAPSKTQFVWQFAPYTLLKTASPKTGHVWQLASYKLLKIFHQTLDERDSLQLHAIDHYLTKNSTSVAVCTLQTVELFSFNPMQKA